MGHNVSAIQSGDQTIVIVDGEHYRKTGADADHIYNKAVEAQTNPSEENVDELLSALDPHANAVADGLLERDDMGNYLLPEYRTPIPESMATHMLDLYDRDIPIEPFKKFWKRALLNPNSQARSDMFKYCQEYGITITQDGYMILYKAVNNNPASVMSDDLIEKIGVEYLRVNRRGESPSDYHVAEDQTGGFHLIRDDVLDEVNVVNRFWDEDIDPWDDKFSRIREFALENNILNAYQTGPPEHRNMVDIEMENGDVETVSRSKFEKSHVGNWVFSRVRDLVEEWLDQDHYIDHGTLDNLYSRAQKSHSGQFEPSSIAKRNDGQYGMSINLGEPVPMPREECDPNIDKSCSKGLHVGSYDYVSSFGGSRDTILACIVSPRDIVSLPKIDNSKLRTCLYVPYAVMERDKDNNWEEIKEEQVNFEYMDEKSDMEDLLSELESKDDLSDTEKDRKEILEDRLKEIN